MNINLGNIGKGLICISLLGASALLYGEETGKSPAGSRKFDFGTWNSTVAAGYIKVDEGTIYDSTRGYGWTKKARISFHRDDPTNPLYYRKDKEPLYDLLYDGVIAAGEAIFRLDSAKGVYKARLYLGDLNFGEGRLAMNVWANGKPVVKNADTAGGTIKVFEFPVEVTGDRLELKFLSEVKESGYYSSIIGLEIEPVSRDKEIKAAEWIIPEKEVNLNEVCQKNWAKFEERVETDWEQAKKELKLSGRWEALKPGPEAKIWGWSFCSTFTRMQGISSNSLDVSKLVKILEEIGFAGVIMMGYENEVQLADEFSRLGFGHFLHCVGMEILPEGTKAISNSLRNKAGDLSAKENVFSIFDPQVVEVIRGKWRKEFSKLAKGASFVLIDEPRGCWYDGKWLGDFSAPAEIAFKKWAGEKGFEESAQKGIPPAGRTEEFYRFYLFRLESVPRYIQEDFIKETPLENLPVITGNGEVGPKNFNHQCLFPPYAAEYGQIPATWNYDDLDETKASSEVIKASSEFKGKSVLICSLGYSKNPPELDQARAVTGLSALPDIFQTYDPPNYLLEINQRKDYMKAAYEISRLRQATVNFKHATPVFLYLPVSLVYNDLVEFNDKEAKQWGSLIKELHKNNIDYRVSYTLETDAPAIAIYAPVRPVLNNEEVKSIKRFLQRGGNLIWATGNLPETPDGKIEEDLAALIKQGGNICWLRDGFKIESLYQVLLAAKFPVNLFLPSTGLKTYLYQKEGKQIHLVNNTNITESVSFVLPFSAKELVTGRLYSQGEPISLGKGSYILLQEGAK